jgi:hypothetical protein
VGCSHTVGKGSAWFFVGGGLTRYEMSRLPTRERTSASTYDLDGLVKKGAIFAWLGYNLETNLSRTGRSPTPEKVVKLELYRSESQKYISRATLLGWHPETPESQRRYLETIEASKKQR